jgi:hypothetical protein
MRLTAFGFWLICSLGVVASGRAAVIYNVTAPASWGASDATIGVAGASIFDFETTQLPTGVSIRFTRGDNNVQAYDTGFGGTLPFVFDTSQDTTGFNVFASHAWDGTRSLVNVPAQPITSYSPSFGWGTIRITFQTPVTLAGFSVQQMDQNMTINVMTNGGLTSTTTNTLGVPLGGGRNGYIRIDGTAGTTISYIELVPGQINGFTDGWAIDHLAFSPQQQSGGEVPEPASALLLAAPLAAGRLLRRRLSAVRS